MDDDSLFKVPEAGSCSSSSKKCRRLSLQSIDLPINYFKRKRKRRNDEDAISLASVDSMEDDCLNTSTQSGRRSSFKLPGATPSKQTTSPSPYRPPAPTPCKRRMTMTWTASMAGDSHVNHLSTQVIKRQEAIYELYQGEKDIAEDLINVRKLYRDSLLTLELCTPEEAEQIFGPIDRLIPVHQDFARRLEQQRQGDGTTQGVGQQIVQWVPKLKVYIEFCGNQPLAKATLDAKRQDAAVQDFLLRCQESPFSRKLDLWGLLDGARGRFVKYPLLIKAILKQTPEGHEDLPLLQTALLRLDEIISQADRVTGKAECHFCKSRLVFLYEEQRIPEVDKSTSLICQGTLKNNKGSKVQVYLFDKVVVVTRPSGQGQQVYRQPIPVSQLVVEDLADGEARMGSFRSAFGQGSTARNVLRLYSVTGQAQAHTLMANDEHSKQQWMRSFQSLTSHIVRIGNSSADRK